MSRVDSPASVAPPGKNPWLIAIVVAIAAFMEILDTSIANVALPYMAGNLGVSNDESTWVLTSYLVSNAVVLPISGWIASVFGRKRFFMACIGFFTLSSLLCGIAPSLPLLLGFRVLQGLGGGGLQPIAQAILADTFPPQQRGLAFALYGITAVIAPAAGPTLGGWITYNYSWRWIFFINLPVGLLALFLVFRLIEDPPYLSSVKRAGVQVDYIGISLLVLGVGSLQVMLDRGQEDDWFGSRFILTLAIIAGISLLALFAWEWFVKHPIIDVRLFRNFNFLSSNVMMFLLGVVLFSSLVMIPQFLQTLMGYTAELAGFVLSIGALLLLIEMPVVGQLTSKIQARYIIAFGWLCLALAMWYSTTQLGLFISFATATRIRTAQVVGLGFLFVPITLAAYVGIPQEKSNMVAGIVNFMRNIGSSVGTSMVTTMIARRSQYHQSVLSGHITSQNTTVLNAVSRLTDQLTQSGSGPHEAEIQARARLYRSAQNQAATLAYIDVFWILAVAATVMFALSFVLRKNAAGARAEAAIE
ncbi:MAG TPA: DHA2 family efflux MFS transporter permease subunit [Terriglobia bacterium]|nr:DHA2 family efflux MFS transporter permease subunit [Terriglobia bacterium]